MDSIEEKRVYGDRSGAVDAYIASSMGVVRVRVAGETVGEFGLCDRCNARDIATSRTETGPAVAVATAEDVRLLKLDPNGEVTAVETGFGPATAVGYHGTTLLAANAAGRLARRTDDNWEPIENEAIETVTAIDGDLIGTNAGVYRVHDGGLDHAGLTAVRDVSVAGIPLAATADGLYKLGNGWMACRDEPFDRVAVDPASDRGQLGRAHAASGRTVYAHDPSDGTWNRLNDLPETIAGIGYGETVYAVTENGQFHVLGADADSWRSQAIGVNGVTGLTVPPEQ